MIGQFSHDDIGRKTRKVCHQSLVGFDPSIVSQTGRFLVRSLLVRLSRSVKKLRSSVSFPSWISRL